MNCQKVLVLDFGGQYKELIAQKVRNLNVYSEIKPGSISADEIRKIAPIGLIFTGGPNSVYADGSPLCDPKIFELGIPVLGICYGMQLMCHTLGGKVVPADGGEYGKIAAKLDRKMKLFDGMNEDGYVLMSHGDRVEKVPEGFTAAAHTDACPIAAFYDDSRKFYGVQFHPEVKQTENGLKIFENFLYKVCGAAGDYNIDDYIESSIKEIRQTVGDRRVLLALSGGVDSSVCAALLSRAIPGQLTCMFIDHGLMRKNEGDEIEQVFSKRDLEFVRINAEDRFLSALKGVSDPESKRKIIGAEFIKTFEEESAKLGDIRLLAQGTIYPDVVESGNGGATIKSHHNVGGLPKNMRFEGLVEPLRGLFKDEVRVLGRKLGLPKFLVERQPFPGPGLAIRVIGDITKEKLDILRDADAIYREEIGKLRRKPDQYFAVLTGIRSVGVMGDGRTYEYVIALRAVNTNDFMTCDYTEISHKVLGRISSRIVNEVSGASRVVYDITGKPPATIEWE